MTPREAAQRYVDAGLRPIPVWPPSAGCRCERKHPERPDQCWGKLPRDTKWADRPLFRAEEFDPTDNIALAMGKQPDGRWLLAIDVDGVVKLDRLELPPTLTTTTGRGSHRIYQVRPDAPFGNVVDVFGARDKSTGYKPGHTGAVDLRYARGAVVAAPSKHRLGATYRSNDAPIAWLPPRASVLILAAWHRKNPAIKRYPTWSADPSHKGKQP
jgi:hypothetical protein